jgi:thiol-disulfide isomerase/thioredoxin
MKIILALFLSLIGVGASTASVIEIDNYHLIEDAHLIIYKDYFSNEILEIDAEVDSLSNRLVYRLNQSQTVVCLVVVNGKELQLVLRNGDNLGLGYEKEKGLFIKKGNGFLTLLSGKISWIESTIMNHGKYKSKKEYNELLNYIEQELDTNMYENQYAAYYTLNVIMQNSFKYKRHIDFGKIGNLLERNWYLHNVPSYISCFRTYTQMVAWKAFHEQKIGNWLLGDTNDIKALFDLEPFNTVALNKTYQFYMIELCESLNLIWRDSFGKRVLKKCVNYFKSESYLNPFVSAFNLNKNYYDPIVKAAYNIDLLDLDSNRIRLNEVANGFLLVDFWATWCIPCVKGMPELNEFQKQNPHIKVVMIGRDKDFSKFKQFVESVDYDIEFYFAGDSKLIQAAYNIQSLPHKVLIGTDRNIYLNHFKDLSELDAYKAFWE